MMKREEFNEIYTNYIRNLSIDGKFHTHGYQYMPYLLSSNTLRLIELFCQESKKPTLLANVSYGELTMCSEQWVGYTNPSFGLTERKSAEYANKGLMIEADFLTADISERYGSIVVVTPHKANNLIQVEAELIRKALNVLEEGGRLIALIPLTMADSSSCRPLREWIMSNYSLEYAITVDCYLRSSFKGVLLVVENKKQSAQVYMSLGTGEADEEYDSCKTGSRGFLVDSLEIYDRLDPHYYDPVYTRIREQVSNRDTVKLGSVADIFCGVPIPESERKKYGDYLIINPSFIENGTLNYGKRNKTFVSDDYLHSIPEGEKCILKRGDMIVSLAGTIGWAEYSGDDDFAVATNFVAIIRGHESKKAWLKSFFCTRIGKEHLESQLRFFSHDGIAPYISSESLSQIVVPDKKMQVLSEGLFEKKETRARIITLFQNLGWDVQNAPEDKGGNTIMLFFNSQCKSVVFINQYETEELLNDFTIAEEFSKYKKKHGNVNIYCFIANDIYEYYEGSYYQLAELPRPDRKENTRKLLRAELHEEKTGILIEKKSVEETSIADRFMMEMITRFDRIDASLDGLKSDVGTIKTQLQVLSGQITGLQSLTERILDSVGSSDERERIIHAFSEEMSQRIMAEVDARKDNNEYEIERKKLILAFEEPTWNKMKEKSQKFLISSKVIFNKLVEMEDNVDYSSVCLLVTKALEVELSIRFHKNFIHYLKNEKKYAITDYPTALIQRDNDGTEYPLPKCYVSLGTLVSVMYREFDNNDEFCGDLSPEQIENNKLKTLEYARDKVFPGQTDEAIITILKEYSESVDRIRKEYRNPSAHTNEIRLVNAKECFNLLIDVEKLLKKMLDSFDT